MMKLSFFLVSSVVALLILDSMTAQKRSKHPSRSLKVATKGADPLNGDPIISKQDMEELKKKIKERITNKKGSELSGKDIVKFNRDVKKAYDTIKQILIRLMLLSGLTPAGHTTGIFVALLDLVISENKQSVWQTVMHRVDARITDAISGYHFNRTKEAFNNMDVMIRIKGKQLDNNDMVTVLSSRYVMLPYNYNDLGYSEPLAALLPTWITYMTTMGWQAATNPEGKLDKCFMGKELMIFRNEVVKSAKSQLRKRYERISGINYFGKSKGSSCTSMDFIPLSCQFETKLTYYDAYTKRGSDESLVDVEHMFKAKKEEMVTSLMKIMVNPINAFFTENICGEGCVCPKNITEEEITHSYPKACYGKTEDDEQCTLPCDMYGYSYYWCPYLEGKTGSDFEDLLDGNYKECIPADWNECMAVPPDKDLSKNINTGEKE